MSIAKTKRYILKQYRKAVTSGKIQHGDPLELTLKNGTRAVIWGCTDPDCPDASHNVH